MGGMKFRRAYAAVCLIMMLVHQSAGKTERLYARTVTVDPPCKYKSVLGDQQIGPIETYPATPQLVASQRMLIHSYTIIGKGTLDAALEAVDIIPEDAAKVAKVAKVAKTLSKTFVKSLGYIAPALGIFSAVLGAAIDVNSPTADDILEEVNKAVTKLAEEVDSRFAEMKDYVDDNLLRLERDLNKNKFTFLMCYWGECVQSMTWKDSEQCQLQAHRLIQASLHEFLPFLPQLNKDKKEIDLSSLQIKDLRQMEASQLNFMNYAFMSMYVTRTLQTTYGFLVQEKKKEKNKSSGNTDDLSPVVDKTCKEFLKERAKRLEKKEQSAAEVNRLQIKEAAEVSEEEVWQGYYCIFQRNFEKNAKLFKMYGAATIKAVGEPNSLVPESPFDFSRISMGAAMSDPKYNVEYVSKSYDDNYFDCNVDTVSCSVPFSGSNPVSESPCKVRVDLLTKPDADDYWIVTTDYRGNPERRKAIFDNCVYSDMHPRSITHDRATHNAVKKYCKLRLQDQNNVYNRRRSEIKKYWLAHVGVLTECYDRLAASSTDDPELCDRKKIQEDLKKSMGALYRRMGDGEKCPTGQRIQSEAICIEAARKLSLTWAYSWNGPSDAPGCIFANDGRSEVFFNTASTANGSNSKYAEICSE